MGCVLAGAAVQENAERTVPPRLVVAVLAGLTSGCRAGRWGYRFQV